MLNASLGDPEGRQKRLRARLHNTAARRNWRPVLAKPELLVFCRPGNGVAQTGHFHKHVRATLQGQTSLAGFRGLPRPSEASLMGFRGLPRPREASTKSQNPFSPQDFEASGTRADIILLKGSPQGLGPGRTLAASLLSSVAILADASFTFRLLHGPRPRSS